MAPVVEYIDSLKAELYSLSELEYIRGLEFSSVYFGGGTPSTIPNRHLAGIMELISSRFRVESDAQLTFEGHVQSLSRTKLRFVRSLGFRRVSTGVQTFEPTLREALNLLPTEEEIIRCVETARDEGFDDFNIDLMYNLPGQSLGVLERDLHRAVALAPTGLDLYETVISQGTPLDGQVKRGELVFDEDVSERARSYLLAEDYLATEGYNQKNLYVWDRAGFENRLVGSQASLRDEELDIVGVGLGAYSLIGGTPYMNESGRMGYINLVQSTGHGTLFEHSCTPQERQERFMIMSLQDFMLDREIFRLRFHAEMDLNFGSQLESFRGRGLIDEVKRGYKLTSAGRAWASTMAIEFFGRNVIRDMLDARTERKSFWPITREEEFDTPIFALYHPELIFRNWYDVNLAIRYARVLRAANEDWLRMLARILIKSVRRQGLPNWRWHGRRLVSEIVQAAKARVKWWKTPDVVRHDTLA
jgi:oxygen-independent coproporphyrinogen-3 oxidase